MIGEILVKVSIVVIVIVPIVLGVVLMMYKGLERIRKAELLSVWGACVIWQGSNYLFYVVGIEEETISYSIVRIEQLNFSCEVLIDGVSLLFILLTGVVMLISVLMSAVESGDDVIGFREQASAIFFTESILMSYFLVTDMLVLYICMEAVAIPTIILIWRFGGVEREQAGYKLFLYTLFGSVFFLLGIIYILKLYGTTNFLLLNELVREGEFSVLIWIGIFMALAVKAPITPVYLWLPEAHSEAPTAGSMVLAGVILKLSGYGVIRLLLGVYDILTEELYHYVSTLCIMGVVYVGIITVRQTDIKRIVAYSSIVHMGYSLLGIFSLTPKGILGGVYLMLAHGLVSSGLFACVGILYKRYGSRNILDYGGVGQMMPRFKLRYYLLVLHNAGIPGSGNFIGEFLSFGGILEKNWLFACVGLLSIVVTSIYMLWMFEMVSHRPVNKSYKGYRDITTRERMILDVILVGSCLLGILADPFLELIERVTDKILML